MSNPEAFINEVALDMASCNRWLEPSTRSLRFFAKGPDAGMNADTGILFLIHGVGAGGKQNDISWKRCRKTLANEYNLLCIGVNFFGTDIQALDGDHITQQASRIHKALVKAGQATTDEVIDLKDDPRYWYYENPTAALEASTTFPTEYWDWGGVQAYDLITTLDTMYGFLDQNGIPFSRARTCLVSRSGGGQIGYQVMKLAPRTISGFLDVGGLCYAGDFLPHLRAVLEDPFGAIAPDHKTVATIDIPDMSISLRLKRKWPIANYSALNGNRPQLDDEVAFRDVLATSLGDDGAASTLIDVRHGESDNSVGVSYKRWVANEFGRRGHDVRFRLVTSEDVDGKNIIGDGHVFVGDFHNYLVAHPSEVFRRSFDNGHTSDIGSGKTYSFASPKGRWEITYTSPPSLKFIPSGKKG